MRNATSDSAKGWCKSRAKMFLIKFRSRTGSHINPTIHKFPWIRAHSWPLSCEQDIQIGDSGQWIDITADNLYIYYSITIQLHTITINYSHYAYSKWVSICDTVVDSSADLHWQCPTSPEDRPRAISRLHARSILPVPSSMCT